MPELQSFSSPILNLQDTFVRAPFFGANYWVASVKPVAGGGIPPDHSAVELRLTFREGGAFDYSSVFEQIKERLYQAYSVARETGRAGTTGLDLATVNLEQLPAYEPVREVEDDQPAILSPVPIRPPRDTDGRGMRSQVDTSSPRPEARVLPDEPPPGYEEAQTQAVNIDLDQRLRHEAEMRRDSDSPA